MDRGGVNDIRVHEYVLSLKGAKEALTTVNKQTQVKIYLEMEKILISINLKIRS